MIWNNLELPEQNIYFKDNDTVIYCADCKDILPLLPKVDLVLTDPPYGINYKPRASSVGKWHKWNCDKVINDNDEFELPFDLFNANEIILWGANAYASILPDNYGWLIWDKIIPDGMKASECELAWTNFLKRTRKFTHLWLGLCRESEVGLHYHPTQKPVVLMEWCINLSSNSNIILDPFLGSGTTAVAAKKLCRKCIGIEISEKYCQISVERLRQSVMRLE
jgi:site-specific DNA-methyltransferase (adenine-specific)/modification methylase